MKGLFAPLLTAVVLVDAATYYPSQYVNNPEAAAIASMKAEPSIITQSEIVYQNVPQNNQDVKPLSTEVVESKLDKSEEQDDEDELDSDDDEVDSKPTSTKVVHPHQTPKPTSHSVELDFEDDGLSKPAGIDFPDGETAEKEFDRVETVTTINYTTSTVYSTVTSTITDCVSTVTECPEKGSVVTKTISMYTTVCPVTTPTSAAPPSDELDEKDSDSPESDAPDSDEPESEILDTESPESESESDLEPDTESDSESDLEPDTESDSDIPAAPEPTQGPYLTKTIETTVWYTVTDCAPKETDCPVGQETSSISTRTEIYPMTDIPSLWSPNSTQIQPYATGSPISYSEPPHTNVTVPKLPPNFTINAGSAQKFNGLLMGFGLVATSAIALLQGWY